MRLTYKSSKLTYKSLFWYSVAIIVLLLLAAPVLANSTSGHKLLDFSRSRPAGDSMQTAQPLSNGLNISHLAPGQENWYAYSRSSFNDRELSWVSLALRYESEARISAEQVNFEVLAGPRATPWSPADASTADALGAGAASPLKTSQSRVETFWTGHVAEQEQYYVRVFNHSPVELDYTLEVKVEQAAVSGAVPASLNTTRPNAIPANARQLAWSLTAQAVENMTAVQAAEWMQQAQAVGWIVTAGTLPEAAPDPAQANPHTLWALTAEAIEGQDAATAAAWLNQADSLGWLSIPLAVPVNPNEDIEFRDAGGDDEGADGGSQPEEVLAVPAPPDEVYTPVNIYPNNPLPFDLNHVNSGRLAPYGEHWYELTRDDLDDELIENMKMTMFFTPIQGFLSNRVNFEIFPAGQYHIWQRGDADYMENMGLGTWVSRDEDPDTGERLWNGTLVDGDRYLIKIKNGTPEDVDYYLYPTDVENAELGNPTLHGANASAGRVPYAASPPTRSPRPPEPGESLAEAIPVEIGTTTGQLEAGQEIWYKFSFPHSGNEKSLQRDFIFYMTNTPLNNIKARHADFAIYPGAQFHLWARGTIDALDPLGTSAPAPYPSGDAATLQVLWDGQLMANHDYYIKIVNHDIGPLEYDFEIRGGPQ